MNRNSQSRQFSTNFTGYLAPQHQQSAYIGNPPLEGPSRFPQNTSFNGRSVVQGQGQSGNLNTAPVPGAPAARFEGHVPFHGTHNNQWIGPTHMMQHNLVAQQGGPHHMTQQRQPYMYAQAGQHAGNPYSHQYLAAGSMSPYPMASIPRPPTAPAPQTTTFSSSGLPQFTGHHPVQALQASPHVQPQLGNQMQQTQRPVINPISNAQMIAGSQGAPAQYGGPPISQLNPSLMQQHQPPSQPGMQARKRTPLLVIDPKTNQPVDLKEASSQSVEHVEPTTSAIDSSTKRPIEENSLGSASSAVEITKTTEAENVKESSFASLNVSAKVFVPNQDVSDQAPQMSPVSEKDNSSEMVSVVPEVSTPEGDKDKEPEDNTVLDAATTDSSDVKQITPLPSSEVAQLPDVQGNAADETVSEKAVVSDHQPVESRQIITESAEPVVLEEKSVEREVKHSDDPNEETTNGDATGEPSENENGPSQDEDDVASDDPSPPSYNFRADSTEAPSTTEMRKLHYDRNYLINLQRCKAALKQPLGLPEELIEQGVILKTAHPLDLTKPLPALKSKGMDDFTPDYARLSQYSSRSGRYSREGQRPGQGGGGGNRYGNSSGSQRRGSQQSSRRIEPVHRQPVKIHQSENAYIPAVLQRIRGNRNVNPEEDTDEARALAEKNRRQRVCFSQLNKLTPQNSDVIFDQIRESGILCDGGGIDDIASGIFKKAITEPPYSVALADLVAKIMGEYESDEMQKHKTFFKQNLLSRCQTMFETDLEKQVAEEEERMRLKYESETDVKIKAMFEEEVDEAKMKVRLKYYGNIKFVGELYLRGLVGAKTIHDCVAMLLQHKTEESIESVCKFLETTGQKLDQGAATVRVDHYFQRIEKIKEKIDSKRLKYKLEDLIDMRRRKWTQRERAALYKVKPMTRAELEKERIEEEQKKQMAVDKMVARKREESRYGSRGGAYSGRSSGGSIGSLMSSGRRSNQDQSNPSMSGNPDGWKTVTSRRVDPRSLTIKTTESNDTDFKLGPTNSLSKWSQGCRTKGRDGADRVTATKNFGRQGLSPSPRNSANSSRRGSNSNIPAAVSTSSGTVAPTTTAGRDSATINRTDSEQTRNGASGVTEAGASNNTAIDRPVDAKTRSQVENKSQHIFSEYSAHKEFDAHAFEPIRSYGDIFVECLVQHVIEKSKQSRIDAGKMISMMIQKEDLQPEDVAEGLKPHFEIAADILMDVPKFYKYIAEFLSGCLCPEIMVSIPTIMAPLEKEPEVAEMVCEMLHIASEENGHDKVGLMFRTAQLDWHMFLPPNTKVDNFIQTNKLEFTLTGGVPKAPDSFTSLEDVETRLENLVTNPKLCVEDIFSLLETVDKRTSTSSEFISMVIRTITTVAIKNSDFELLHNCSPVLKYIINEETERMLQALYAVQQITPKTADPSRINAVFEVLLDNNVILDDAYLMYYELKRPEISDGYESTLRATANFYATLMNT